MPVPGISGLSSGMNTDDIIEKLVKIESQPIKRLENEIKARQREQDAWTKVLSQLQLLQSSLRVLYSVNHPFGDKVALSSQPEILSVTANRYAEPMTHYLKVILLAMRHKISSDAILKNTKLPSGNFIIRVNKIKKKLFFSGGSVQDLFNLLNEKAGTVIIPSLIKKNDDEYVLTIESKTSGSRGSIDIEDTDNLFRTIGIHKVNKKQDFDWQLPISEAIKKNDVYDNMGKGYFHEDFWFWNQNDLVQLQQSRLSQAKKQTSSLTFTVKDSTADKKNEENNNANPTNILTLNGSNHLRFSFSEKDIALDTKLILQYRADFIPENTKQNKDSVKAKQGERIISLIPGQKIEIGGNLLQSQGLDRNEKDFSEWRKSLGEQSTRESTQKEEDKGIRGLVRIHLSDGKTHDFAYQAPALTKDLQLAGSSGGLLKLERSLAELKGKKIREVEIIHQSGTVSILHLGIETSQKKNVLQYKNELASAQDAAIEFGGVLLRRSKNESIDDIIKGLSLNLLSARDTRVEIRITVDTEKAKKAIDKFITEYNKFIELADSMQIQPIEPEIGKYSEQKKKTGILAGDATLQRLVSDLKMMATNSYPNTKKSPIKIFFQMGVSTGRIGGRMAEARKGLLKIIDENLLIKQLIENHEAVREFFASDPNGDRKVNDGLAFRMNHYIQNYTQTGNYGLITVKIDLTKRRIQSAEKSIERQRMHVENYRQRLKKSFQAMERGMSKNKSEQQWLKNQMRNAGGQ